MRKIRRIRKVLVAFLLALSILVAENSIMLQTFRVSATNTNDASEKKTDKEENAEKNNDKKDADEEEDVATISDDSYKAYLKKHDKLNRDVEEFTVEFGSDGEFGTVEEGEFLEFTVRVNKTGLYRIGLDYYPEEGRGQEIRQSLMIDGEYPFAEAKQLILSRVWKDESEISTDSEGNDIYPGQIQTPEWITYYLRDSHGYYAEPFLFALTEGEHVFRFSSIEEPVVIRSVLFTAEQEILSYKDALAEYYAAGYSEVKDYFDKRQAEKTDKKSSSMLSAVSDRTDPAIEPYDGTKIKLNVLGGGRFDTNGMWVEYNIEVPSDGLYQLAFKVKQNNMKEQSAYRNIYVNGEIPYKEAVNFSFDYSNHFENKVFGNESGAYLIKLNAGENTIRLEASLGDIADFCRALDDSLEILNAAYRKIVTITGTAPDVNRDYSLNTKMPDVIETFEEQYEILTDISEQMKEKYGISTSYTAAIDTLTLQLKSMYKNHYDIPSNVSAFNSNLSTLGSKVEGMKTTDITLDYFMITGTENILPKPTAGFLKKILFSIQNFFNSFTGDYSVIGSTDDYDENIEVWIIGGREQAQILKQMVNSDFSVRYGVGVNVKLISDIGTLQKATMAGEGPDVAIGVAQSDAMDFAFRGAVKNLSEYDDLESVTSQFADSAIEVLTYNSNVMAIPQTMDYPVLFYREDVLEELGVDVPTTWDDIYELLPVLAQNNMTFGLPVSSAADGSKASLTSFGALLYQRGGKYYDDDLLSVTFSDELTIRTMSDWTELYISYGLPISYNFVNRFAAGDMPIAIQNYSAYNTMVLYAPQLSNVWKWTTIPGTVCEDGTVNHSVPITVTASIILSDTEQEDAAWEFVKWWSWSDTQSDFGKSVEELLGKAGRYNTANIAAMNQIPWSGTLYKGLTAQLEWTAAVPEIPGGYYTSRYLDNAFREIYENSTEGSSEIRKVMYQYDQIVDDELVYQSDALRKAANNERQEE